LQIIFPWLLWGLIFDKRFKRNFKKSSYWIRFYCI